MADVYPIAQDYEAYMKSRVGEKTLQNNFRASTFGHPCGRKHYYDRTEYREPYPWTLLAVFDEGNLQEPAIINTLQAMGYVVDSTQRSYRIEEDGIVLTMRIDGTLCKMTGNRRGSEYPFDAKTMNPWSFDSMNSAEDFLHAKKHYLRQYPVQLLCAMYKLDAPYGCLVIKNKQNGRLKDVWFSFDEHVSWLSDSFKRAKVVEAAVAKKEPPDRTDDLDLCMNCDWRATCLPDIKTAPGVKLIEGNEALAENIARMEELKEGAKEYGVLEKENKKPFRNLDSGEYIVGDWLVRCKDRPRTNYNIPKDVKDKYKEEATSRYVTFVKLGE